MEFSLAAAQSLIGVFGILAICWLLSENKRRFPFLLTLGVLAVQAALILLLFQVPAAQAVLQGIGQGVEALGKATTEGVKFVFGFLAGGDQPYAVTNEGAAFIFAFRVLPVILVICALSALLWHWGVLKVITKFFGLVFQKTMGLRGPPALAVAATVFMGQVEGPIFIRSYLEKLTRSELFMLIAVGMSCVSGSTLVAYAAILHDVLPNATAHVLTASVISAPAGVLLSRIMVPADPVEKSTPFEGSADKTYDSSIDAVMKGTSDGMNVAVNVAACLIVFVAIVALINLILASFGDVGGAPLSVQRGLGIVFSPLAYAIGIPWSESQTAGSLLGVKLVQTEFTAFIELGKIPVEAMSERTRVILTYALCGFANVASVGINVGGFSVLVPSRRAEIMGLVWKAMLTGFLATCLTAAVVALMPWLF
jgi:CNT family concentrative nucleoside transporter